MDIEAHVHIVLDAYHGDVVSLPGRLGTVEDGPAPADEQQGSPVRLRVACAPEPGDRPRADGWYVRVVGPGGVLDARSSDGSLRSLRWDDEGFTVTLDGGDVAALLAVRGRRYGEPVAHVLLRPEARRR